MTCDALGACLPALEPATRQSESRPMEPSGQNYNRPALLCMQHQDPPPCRTLPARIHQPAREHWPGSDASGPEKIGSQQRKRWRPLPAAPPRQAHTGGNAHFDGSSSGRRRSRWALCDCRHHTDPKRLCNRGQGPHHQAHTDGNAHFDGSSNGLTRNKSAPCDYRHHTAPKRQCKW